MNPKISLESHRVYRALYPRKPTLAWTYSLVGALILYGFSWIGELFPYDRLVATAIIAFLIIWGIHRAILMPTVWYFLMRGWQTRLPFKLIGWDACLSDSRVLNRKYWRDLTVTISPSSTSSEITTALEATLMLFCRTARNSYYVSDSGAPLRPYWSSTTSSATGSANNRVFGLLLELLHGPIARIARMSNTKLTVTLTPTKEFYYVKSDPLGELSGIGS